MIFEECNKCKSRYKSYFFVFLASCMLGVGSAFVTKNEMRREIRNEIVNQMLEKKIIERVEE